jgi:hypothetical protein
MRTAINQIDAAKRGGISPNRRVGDNLRISKKAGQQWTTLSSDIVFELA